MTIDFKSFLDAYKKFLAAHPKVAAVIVIAESALVGAVVDVFSNGFDLSSKTGVKHALVFVGTTTVVAVRNYFKSNAANLKLQLDQKAAQVTK